MTAHPNVIADLDRLGLAYEVMDCDPDLADTAQFCEAYGVPLEKSANAILVASKKPEGHHAVCVVLAHTRLDVNGAVRRKLGVRKLSFAPGDLLLLDRGYVHLAWLYSLQQDRVGFVTRLPGVMSPTGWCRRGP